MRWLRRAAKQGSVDAQYNLGLIYADGRGVLQDNLLRIYGEISFIEVHIGCEVRHRTPGRVQSPF